MRARDEDLGPVDEDLGSDPADSAAPADPAVPDDDGPAPDAGVHKAPNNEVIRG